MSSTTSPMKEPSESMVVYKRTWLQTPDLAFQYIKSKEAEIKSILAQLRWDGEYLLQAGFDEESLCMTSGKAVEEMHIYLGCNFSRSADRHVVTLFAPPVSQSSYNLRVHTPSKTYTVTATSSTGDQHQHNSSRSCGQATGSSSQRGGQGFLPNDGHGGEGDMGSGSNENRAGNRGGGGSEASGVQVNRGTQATSCTLDIPWSSQVNKPGNDEAEFTVESSIKITIEKNQGGKFEPPASGLSWHGPWITVDISSLNCSVDSRSKYRQNLMQVEIEAQSCQPFQTLDYSPLEVRFEDNFARVRRDRTNTRSLTFTLNPNPGMQLAGSSAQTISIEGSERKWMVTTIPTQKRPTGQIRRGRIWKFAYNEKFPRVVSYQFPETPSLLYGLEKAAISLRPIITVDTTMCWSLIVNSFDFLRIRDSDASPPAFKNILHHVSISCNLADYDAERGWAMQLDTCDVNDLCPPGATPRTPQTIDYGLIASPVRTTLEAGASQLFQPIMTRAIRGTPDPLKKEVKKGSKSLWDASGINRRCCIA